MELLDRAKPKESATREMGGGTKRSNRMMVAWLGAVMGSTELGQPWMGRSAGPVSAATYRRKGTGKARLVFVSPIQGVINLSLFLQWHLKSGQEDCTMAKKETKATKGGKKTLKGSSKLKETKLMFGGGNKIA